MSSVPFLRPVHLDTGRPEDRVQRGGRALQLPGLHAGDALQGRQ